MTSINELLHLGYDPDAPLVMFMDEDATIAFHVTVETRRADATVDNGEKLLGLFSTGEYVHVADYSENDEPKPKTCGATYVTRGHDPYATDCDREPNHEGKHEGDDPLGGAGRVRWNGGGSCAGDRLPYRDVEWVEPTLVPDAVVVGYIKR